MSAHPAGAQNVLAQIHDAVARLAEQPMSGHATDAPSIRVLLVGKYPYKIFYRIRTDIEIIHIRHTARGPNAFA
jgi:plasmid stabilization system protein ParE